MIKTNIELVDKLKEIVTNHKTLYVMGCFGAPLKSEHKERYCNSYDYNKQPVRTAMIKAASPDTFGFDCVCLIKGVLWGWNGDKNKVYGGAVYQSNGVPDIDCDVMFDRCLNKSGNFSEIEIGEAVWFKGHIGVYIGDGLAVECTPAWDNCVQISAVQNIGSKNGYNSRKWAMHGKLPYIVYEKSSNVAEGSSKGLRKGDEIKLLDMPLYGSAYSTKKSAIISGTYWIHSDGIVNGKIRITQPKGNKTCTGWIDVSSCNDINSFVNTKSDEETASEVIRGKWGNGEERRKRLAAAGYDPDKIQTIVNKLIK